MADAKTALILSSPESADEYRLNSGSSMRNGVVTIRKKLFFRVPDGANPLDYSDIDVYSHPNFPRKNSVLSCDPRYRFTGDASIEHPERGKYFTVSLDYSTEDPNATDSEGESVSSDTPPWKLRPTNINFSYPETTVAFDAAYNASGKLYEESVGKLSDGTPVLKAVCPVQNSAFDKISATRAVRDLQISFTFATRDWSIEDALACANSINLKSVTVCGIPIAAGNALLLPPECEYITTYEDNSTTVKWQYWSVNVVIRVNLSGILLKRKFMNTGNRAFFPDDMYYDDIIFALPIKAEGPSPIFRIRKAVKSAAVNAKGETYYLPTGLVDYVGYQQMLAIRAEWLAKTNGTNIAKYDIMPEECPNMPLISAGPQKGQVDVPAVDGSKPYDVLSFREFPYRDWGVLNLPEKGVKWQ